MLQPSEFPLFVFGVLSTKIKFARKTSPAGKFDFTVTLDQHAARDASLGK